MNNITFNQKVVLGQKVQFLEKNEPHSSTEVKSDKKSPSISVIYKSKNGVVHAGIFYVRVNFKRNKKKEAYRKINEILGDWWWD